MPYNKQTFMCLGRRRTIFQKEIGGPYYVRFQHKGIDTPRCLWTALPPAAKERARLLIEGAYNAASTAETEGMKMIARLYNQRLPKLIPPTAIRIPLIKTPGIYFLMKHGEVQYVGQSVNVFGRVGAHMATKDGLFDEIAFVPVEFPQLNAEEFRYIKALKPPLNRCPGRVNISRRWLRPRRSIRSTTLSSGAAHESSLANPKSAALSG